MSTDNLKIESDKMDRFRILLTRKHGRYHGLLTEEGSQAIDEYCDRLEKELDETHGSASSREDTTIEVVELESMDLEESLEAIVEGPVEDDGCG